MKEPNNVNLSKQIDSRISKFISKDVPPHTEKERAIWKEMVDNLVKPFEESLKQ